MLTSLSIHNIVLIDKAEIELAPGLCILSGETGSGKSILLDALGLAIGFRANFRLIGGDENKAQVAAEFDISQNEICKKFLTENDLLDSENPSLLRIRRTINENSVNKIFVNDNAIGVNLLAKVGETLVEIHGQHDQRGLLNPSAHLAILDEFAGNENLLKNLKKIYENLRVVEEKISDISAKKEAAAREKDYLEHVVQELENAELKADEENELIAKKDFLISKEKILNFSSDLKSHLLEANSQLLLAQKILIRNQNLGEDFDGLSEKIDRQNDELDSAISSIEALVRKISADENNLDEIEERLFFIRALARKFNVPIDSLPQIILDAQEKLKLLSNEEEFVGELEKQRLELNKDYKKIADELSERRKKSAKILSEKVEAELKFLKMGETKFLIDIARDSLRTVSLSKGQGDDLGHAEPVEACSPAGYDRVRFTASLNKNGFDDISKIASGGELSRFMLALKVALLDVKSVPTMIFDEIDTGIGGSTADAVGKRLKTLSEKLQILVVTHQPQIAAKAKTHFKISKVFSENKAKTEIKKLDKKDREQEIARMLSGEEISVEAVLAAKSLIEN
ncbi:MAG: DNA repair protein RecN [Proteobacteria bacterium]|nr:DNA repair protein RecN [Pseudomonadota bacterium]